MNRCRVVLGMVFLALFQLVADDGVIATRVQGGPPLLGDDGSRSSPPKTVLTEIRGTNFTALLPEAKAVTALIGHERIWWDVPPDGNYVSLVVELGGQTWTLNSCYPFYKNKPTIAVTDIGLVAVSSRREKEARERRNSERYRQLLAFFDRVLGDTPVNP